MGEKGKGSGFHPLWAFVDHGPGGTGESPSVMLRPGKAGSNTAADYVTVIRRALGRPASGPEAEWDGGSRWSVVDLSGGLIAFRPRCEHLV